MAVRHSPCLTRCDVVYNCFLCLILLDILVSSPFSLSPPRSPCLLPVLPVSSLSPCLLPVSPRLLPRLLPVSPVSSPVSPRLLPVSLSPPCLPVSSLSLPVSSLSLPRLLPVSPPSPPCLSPSPPLSSLSPPLYPPCSPCLSPILPVLPVSSLFPCLCHCLLPVLPPTVSSPVLPTVSSPVLPTVSSPFSPTVSSTFSPSLPLSPPRSPLSFRMFLSLNSEEQTTQPPRGHIVSEGGGLIPSHIRNRPSSNTRRESTETTEPDKKDEHHRSCLKERAAAIKINQEDPNGKTFSPECTATGKYKKTQCYNNICWCVDEETGKSIHATTSFNKSLNCDMKPDREMKGCPRSQKRRFLVDLMTELKAELRADRNATETIDSVPTEDLSGELEPSIVVKWKMNSLDVNKNGLLERKELTKFKRDLRKRKKKSRKCGRNFLRYCDADKNKKITLEEFNDCMGVNRNYHSMRIDSHRFGQNPLNIPLLSPPRSLSLSLIILYIHIDVSISQILLSLPHPLSTLSLSISLPSYRLFLHLSPICISFYIFLLFSLSLSLSLSIYIYIYIYISFSYSPGLRPPLSLLFCNVSLTPPPPLQYILLSLPLFLPNVNETMSPPYCTLECLLPLSFFYSHSLPPSSTPRYINSPSLSVFSSSTLPRLLSSVALPPTSTLQCLPPS
ncbi:unnamed protein product [Acanthosepion pharaonis]|uniref:Thyroglobulin type-1 domain-containing protein n=1 Tax=Acanthosepion pharaonis TaxID=158019 RepID=A0A812ANB5_ACAPH|nr:unnamed protein product [Sepia pharaonis]